MPTGLGVQECIHQSLVESCSLDVLIVQHCRLAKQVTVASESPRAERQGMALVKSGWCALKWKARGDMGRAPPASVIKPAC